MLGIKSYIGKKHPGLWHFLCRLTRPTAPLPFGLWLLNFIVQRVFRVNGDVPWMVHYTSCVVVPERITMGLSHSLEVADAIFKEGTESASATRSSLPLESR